MTNKTISFKSKRRLASALALFVLVIASVPNSVFAAPVSQDWVSSASTTEVAQDFQVLFKGFVIPSTRLVPMTAAPTVVDVTAYTSSVEECDSTPFITADGSHTADGIVAANFLPFGTKVKIPSLFGDKIFTVHDRMNTRFNDRSKYLPRVDVWMEKKADMEQFGIHKRVDLVIVEMGNGEKQWGKTS